MKSVSAPCTARGHVAVFGPGQQWRKRNDPRRLQATCTDVFLAGALQVLQPREHPLPALLARSTAALEHANVPSTRMESYRFTDVSPITKKTLAAPPAPAPALAASAIANCSLSEEEHTRVAVVDGNIDLSSSDLAALPDGVYIGPASSAPAGEAADAIGMQSSLRGGVFAQLNSATLHDPLVIYIPPNTTLAAPLHVLYLSSSISCGLTCTAASSPRLLVYAGPGARAEVFEEFSALEDGEYYVNSVTEVIVAQDSQVVHGVVMADANAAMHTRSTFVSQDTASKYSLLEARVGGSITRHDVDIEQRGRETSTTMKHLLLCGAGQLHDLHTSLKLNHPAGFADQLHKCIVSDATGRGVFDGNVQVNQLAQKTDAGQLSRNLLLAPKATVNVKPNLQIVADDVKCTHGCTVSDLSTDELFYFRSRGIDQDTARQALVYSFGAEVLQNFKYGELVRRLQEGVLRQLSL